RMMYRTSNSVEDELLIMSSRSIMERVVSELDSNIIYSTKSKIRYNYLTAQKSPVNLAADTIRYPFNISIKSIDEKGNGFRAILEYRLPSQKRTEKIITGKFGEPVTDTAGIFRLYRNTAVWNDAKMDNTIKIHVNPIRNAAEAYSKGALNVSLAQKYSNIDHVSLTDNNPQKAAALTNKLIEVYNDEAINSKRKTAEATIRFIDERLGIVKNELSDVDTAIEKFKSDNSAVDIMSETKLSLETSRDYNTQLLETEIQLEMLHAIDDILDDEEEIVILPVNIGINDQSLANAINKYNELVLERMRLGTETSDNNPVIREMHTQIISSQQSLRQSIDNLSKSLNIQKESLQKTLT